MADRVRTAQSLKGDARSAVAEVAAGIRQPNTALVIFFCSSRFGREELAEAIGAEFDGIPAIGCTTAGEFGPLGYVHGSLVASSFPSSDWEFAIGRIDGLRNFSPRIGQRLAADLVGALDVNARVLSFERRFGLTLIDGLSLREEPVARAFQDGLGIVPLVGGSAGDDLAFAETAVFHEGRFHQDAAVLCVARTRCPFRVFKTQHFARTERRLVITDADPVHRVVRSINGRPAAAEYARIIGSDHSKLTHDHFSDSPVVVLIDGSDYVRAIRSSNDDGSLTLYCAIEEGVVLRTAHGVDIVQNLKDTFSLLRRDIGPIQSCLAFDCILRNLETDRTGHKEEISRVLRNNCAIGFSTYGEQYRGVHVNQTMTGVAIGSPQTDIEERS